MRRYDTGVTKHHTRVLSPRLPFLMLPLPLPSDAGTDAAQWLRGIINKITRVVVERKVHSGQPLDNSVTPVSRCHIMEINKAYAKADGIEAATRKFAIGQTYRSAGRAGESAFQTIDAMEWSQEDTCVFMEVGQMKTAKVKISAMVAGACRHLCFFLDMADYLATHVLPTHKAWEATFIFPGMQDSECGRKVGEFIKAVLPRARNGQKKYADFAVTSLPQNPTAGGIRPACINLLVRKMPIEFVKATTGHAESGAIDEYIDASLAMALPGAIVLAGWSAFPWGQLGDGPAAPCLGMLSNCTPSVCVGDLDGVINLLFNLDSASGLALYASQTSHSYQGRLRPMVEACFAAIIMYYHERVQAEEMMCVNNRLIDLLVQESKGRPWEGSARAAVEGMVRQWGEVIRTDFEAENAHLRVPQNGPQRGGSPDSLSVALQQVDPSLHRSHLYMGVIIHYTRVTIVQILHRCMNLLHPCNNRTNITQVYEFITPVS